MGVYCFKRISHVITVTPTLLSGVFCLSRADLLNQALYKHDWRNFMERNGITSEQQAMSKKHIQSTRLWASFRAQTLARTVEGIMYYEAALRLLARLERVKEDQVNCRLLSLLSQTHLLSQAVEA